MLQIKFFYDQQCCYKKYVIITWKISWYRPNIFLWWWCSLSILPWKHDDVIKWKHFPHNWPFVWGIHQSPVNSPHKGQWRGALMFSLICVWINRWVNNSEAGDLRRHLDHYDVSVMKKSQMRSCKTILKSAIATYHHPWYFCQDSYHLMAENNIYLMSVMSSLSAWWRPSE